MAWYRTGTVSVTNGNPAVVGTNTLWLAQVKTGDVFTADGVTWYEIATLTGDGALTLDRNYAGSTNATASYAIIRNFNSSTAADIASSLSLLMNKYHLTLDEMIAWLTDGGDVTLHDALGNAYTVASAAKLASTFYGTYTLDAAGSTATITPTADQASKAFFIINGVRTANLEIIVPAAAHLFGVYNNTSGAYTVTVKTAAGSGVTVTQGKRALLLADGTNVVNADTDYAIDGIGTIATQNANAVAITGGAINGTTIGASTPSTGAFTTLSATGIAKAGYLAATGSLSAYSSATGGGYLYFAAGATQIQSVADNAATAAPLIFLYGASEAMRINTAGRLLVGQTSDNGVSKVQITGQALVTGDIAATGAVVGGTRNLMVENTDTTNAASHAYLQVKSYAGGGDPYVYLNVNGLTNWSFGADRSDSGKFKISPTTTLGGSEAITIDGSGRTTFGAVSSYPWPATVEVRDTFRVFDAASSSYGLRVGFNANRPYLDAYRETVGSLALILNNSGGNVLVGTTTDDGLHKLQINGSVGLGSGFSLRFGTTAYSFINGTDTASSYLRFGTSGAEIMRLTPGQKVLIGTSTDNGVDRLQVSGGAYVSGVMAIGTTTNSIQGLKVGGTLTGGTTQIGITSMVTGDSGGTSVIEAFRANLATAAAAYTVTDVIGLRVLDVGKGAGSTVSNQFGIRIDDLSSGTGNYGVQSQLSAGAAKWNIYASGTAKNYFAGTVLVGTSADNGTDKLQVEGSVGIGVANAIDKPVLKIQQATGLAGGAKLWLTAAGGGSDTNAATIQLHNAGAFWGRTDMANGGIRWGAYDKAAAYGVLGSNVLIGTTTDNNADRLQVVGTANILYDYGTNAGISVVANSTATTNTAGALKLQERRSQTTTNFTSGTTVILQNSDSTTNNFEGIDFYDNTGVVARICAVNENHTTHVGRLEFHTRNAGAYAERMRIVAVGNVLIGTTTDDGTSKLQVSGAVLATGLNLQAAGLSGTNVLLLKNTTAGQASPGLYFYNGDGYRHYFQEGAGSAGLNIVSVDASPVNITGNGSATAALTMDGNLLVSAAATKYVGVTATNNSQRAYFQGTAKDSGGTSYTATVGAHGDSACMFVGVSGAQPIQFWTNGTEKMRVTSVGNVLIGTTAETGTERLQVSGNASVTGLLKMFVSTNPATDNGTALNAMRITTTIAQAADVGGALSLGGWSNATGSNGHVGFGQIAGRKENGTADNYAGYLQFATNNATGTMAEAMRITSGRNVVIGSTADDGVNKLQVTGNVQITGAFAASSNVSSLGTIAGGSRTLYVENSDATNAASHALINAKTQVGGGDPFARFDVAGVVSWSVGADRSDAGKFKISPTATLGGSEAVCIATGGNVLIGTATDNGTDKLQVNGSLSAANLISCAGSTAGGYSSLYVSNAASTNAASHARLHINTTVGGGDPYIRFDVGGLTNWSMGVDRSNSARFVITPAATLDGTEQFAITCEAQQKVLIGTTSSNGSDRLQVAGGVACTGLTVTASSTPASATATGVAGQVCWDANYVYICTATNTWKRAAISPW